MASSGSVSVVADDNEVEEDRLSAVCNNNNNIEKRKRDSIKGELSLLKNQTAESGAQSSGRPLKSLEKRESLESSVANESPPIGGKQETSLSGSYQHQSTSDLSTSQFESTTSGVGKRQQVCPVKSLESNEANNVLPLLSISPSETSTRQQARICSRATSATTSGASSSQNQQHQQKQMFSLKQLAINSRNLAKKRTNSRVAASNRKQDVPVPVHSNSSSSSSRENSINGENQPANEASSELAESELDSCESSDDTDRDDEDEENDDENSEDSYDDYKETDYEDHRQEIDDSNTCDPIEGAGVTSRPDATANLRLQTKIKASEKRARSRLSPSARRRQRKRKKERGRAGMLRRSSCCHCEPLINKIDLDGLPVTDVDLVTYKDLCQMEQQVHQLRAATTTRLGNNFSGGQLDVQSAKVHFGGLQPICQQNIRRSSLQEESGAYYQLCTSNEEQQIRAKYVWYPPSLKHPALVDKFFEPFPREKVPLVVMSSNTSSDINSAAAPANPKGVVGPAASSRSPDRNTSSTTGSQQHPATSSLASAYRDEQISCQLPRQDISIDYCSYPMDELARAAYQQFVERRNTQALDVGCVVQIRPNNSLVYQPQLAGSSKTLTGSGDKSSASESLSGRRQRLQQRKNSTISYQSTVLAPNQQTQQVESLVQGRQASQASGGAQRCRRCLVRFEVDQLAVLAPNFIIGGALYRPVVASQLNGAIQTGSGSGVAQLQPALSRRASSSTVPGPFSPRLGGGPQLSVDSRQFTIADDLLKPPNNVALFHPTCFTCSTCKEFLVDLVYCLRENRLYCLRHYGESLRPRCSWCKELIFSDEYLKAMNENFHVDHFLCRHCDSNLAGKRYVLKEEKPFCIQCYEGNFANVCEDCSKPIGIDSRDLSYKERHWHDTCFLCNKCQQSLIDKPFGSKADKVYCADCYDVTFATKCDGCQNPFRAGSKKMEYRGRQWHDSCFCCCVCQNTIGSNSFIPKNDEIYCIKCYEDKYATRCTKCKQVIVTGGVTFRNEPWHRDCFNCCNCSKSLAGQRFTTRDVTNETVKNTNKTNQPHNAYCIDCYGELFAKKCFACSQAITGLGGTRFITFEERSWHNDCFVCNDCTTSLVGKGFITDGPETILCSDCARAKLR